MSGSMVAPFVSTKHPSVVPAVEDLAAVAVAVDMVAKVVVGMVVEVDMVNTIPLFLLMNML